MHVSGPVRFAVLALTAALLLLAPSPASAAWSNDVALGTYLSLGWVNSTSGEPCMVADGVGGYWLGTPHQVGFSMEFELVHVSPSGTILAYVLSEAVSGSSKTSFVLVPDGVSGVFVVWRDARGGGDIYAARYNSAGARMWTAGGVLMCSNASAQSNPAAARLSLGYLMVGWSDFRSGDADIYAQLVNPGDGSVYWGAAGTPVAVVAGSAQDSVAILADDNSGATFVWQDGRNAVTTGVDLYAQHMSFGSGVYWTWYPTGALVSNAVGNAGRPQLVSAGSWVDVVWDEDRGLGTGFDVYAQRITRYGGGTAFGTGLAVCNAAGDQRHPVATSDGLGGAIVAWDDARNSASTLSDIYAQRVGSGGIMQWTANGIALCAAAENQGQPRICSDGANGAIVAWCDLRTGLSDVYARRVLSSGVATWTSNGTPIATGGWWDGTPLLVPDGVNGALISYGSNSETLGGSPAYRLYGQRVDRFGMIGSPEPVIAKVKDVPNDQGGLVRVSWNASYLDAMPSNKVDEYWVWREAPVFAATSYAGGAASGGDGLLRRAEPSAAGVIYWERIAVVPATDLAGYSVVAATTSDSISGSNPRTRFQVEAHQLGTEYFWASAPDSGYSVDNLGPAAPAPQYAIYSGGTTRLGWLPNHEADLLGYEVHRGSNASFTPSPATFVTSQPDTGLVDAAGAPYFYKLVAVDVHGNRSPVATLAPTGTLDAPGASVAEAFFASPSPNPARGGTTLRFGLAREGQAKLAIYDAAGRLVRTVHAGTLAAGEQAMRWDARGESGRDVAPGLYLARLETTGAPAMVRRIVVTQ